MPTTVPSTPHRSSVSAMAVRHLLIFRHVLETTIPAPVSAMIRFNAATQLSCGP
jgi:hypothetical protein